MIKQPWKTLLLSAGVLAALGGFGFWWWLTSGYVTTDDARVKADIVAISAELTAKIDSLTKTEGDKVSRDEVLATLDRRRSEEHTSELQSPCNLVCRLLLEKKKQKFKTR